MEDPGQLEQKIERLSKKVEHLSQLTKENNRILLQMRRNARIARFMTLLYWIVIGGSMVALYYHLQPYLEGAETQFSELRENLQRFTPQQTNGE